VVTAGRGLGREIARASPARSPNALCAWSTIRVRWSRFPAGGARWFARSTPGPARAWSLPA